MKNFGKRKIRIKWFTLVELIVVITILAVLATIGFLALSGYSQDAKDSRTKANVRSVQTAIASESVLTGNSPRYYVIHDPDYALSGAFAYVDGTGIALTGGAWDAAGTNYTAGKPDYVKLKLNPEKFKIATVGIGGKITAILGTDSAQASFDPASAMVGAADFSEKGPSGRTRSISYFQTAGISPVTKIAAVAGNFPATSVPGYVSWLIRVEPGSSTNLTGALMDGGYSNASAPVPGASCTLPWGGTLADGSSVAAYSTGTVNEPATCSSVAVTATCNNGVFSHPTATNACVRKDPNFSNVVMLMHLSTNTNDVKGKSVTNAWGASASGGTGPWGGSSTYFNGTAAAQLTTPDSADFAFWAGDVTVEAFLKWDGTISGTYGGISLWGQNCWATSNMRLSIIGTGVNGYFAGYGSSDTALLSSTAGTVPINTWTHVAYVKQWSTYRIFVNGVKKAETTTGTATLTDQACVWQVGSEESVAISLRGYMAEYRVTKGIARYAADFTAPTEPFSDN